MSRAALCIPRILEHEGGYVDHPRDPGGATNMGVTIGTLRRLGIDVDGDGDSDLADLKALRVEDAVKVYKTFYWDAVSADLLPVGLDYATADFAVNSGVSRAAKFLQEVLGVTADGIVGPKTLAAAQAADAASAVSDLCDNRMSFLRRLSTWSTFGRGWTARVEGVEAAALRDIAQARLADSDAGQGSGAPAVERPETLRALVRSFMDQAEALL